MRINSINAYNSTPLNFQGKDKKSSGLKNAAKATILATALSAAAPMYQSCDKLTQDIVHNHYLKLPTDTFTKEELRPTPVPPQIIFIETEVHGKPDTIIQHDTTYLPGDTIIKPDTIYLPGDTTFIKPDTVYLPGDTIIKHDTTYIEKPPVIQRDTVYLPGDTVFIKDEWKSDVPPKQEEIYEDLGIVPNGDGKFFISESYYDEKNNQLVQRHLHGQGSSRDGKILVYNVIKTAWDDESEGVVLGKNEEYEKQLIYLSEDGNDLGVKIMKPKVDIKAPDNRGKSNWQVFTTGTLSTPDAWNDSESFFMQSRGGVVDLTNGFKLQQGLKNQSVTTINPYNSQWELSDWNVVKGDAD